MSNKYPSSAIVMELACNLKRMSTRAVVDHVPPTTRQTSPQTATRTGSAERLVFKESDAWCGTYVQRLCNRAVRWSVSAREHGVREQDSPPRHERELAKTGRQTSCQGSLVVPSGNERVHPHTHQTAGNRKWFHFMAGLPGRQVTGASGAYTGCTRAYLMRTRNVRNTQHRAAHLLRGSLLHGFAGCLSDFRGFPRFLRFSDCPRVAAKPQAGTTWMESLPSGLSEGGSHSCLSMWSTLRAFLPPPGAGVDASGHTGSLPDHSGQVVLFPERRQDQGPAEGLSTKKAQPTQRKQRLESSQVSQGPTEGVSGSPPNAPQQLHRTST